MLQLFNPGSFHAIKGIQHILNVYVHLESILALLVIFSCGNPLLLSAHPTLSLSVDKYPKPQSISFGTDLSMWAIGDQRENCLGLRHSYWQRKALFTLDLHLWGWKSEVSGTRQGKTDSSWHLLGFLSLLCSQTFQLSNQTYFLFCFSWLQFGLPPLQSKDPD